MTNANQEVRDLAQSMSIGDLPAKPVVVYGSSTVEFWENPAADTARADIVPIGVNGATLGDCIDWYELLVAPIKPDALVVAVGANDIERDGVDAAEIVRRMGVLVDLARKGQGELKILILTLKPAPFHTERMDVITDANRALGQWVTTQNSITLVDSFTPFVDADGVPLERYYASDLRHMNEKGYQLWGSVIRTALEECEL